LIGSYYFAEIFKGFQRVLGDTEWDFALFDTLSPSFNDASKIEKLYRTRRVDGLLVVAPHANDAFLDTLAELRIPLIVVGETITSSNVGSVACDEYQGVELLCSHLYSLGHRRIAFVGGPEDLTSAKRRERAFLEFCRSKNLEVPAGFVQVGDYTMQSGREAGLFLLGIEARPTAILAANDMMAFGVIESTHELDINIPREVSVAGFDDLPTAAERFPSLTTVHQPVAEMAERSAQLLVDALNSGELPKNQITFPVSLVTRASTAAPPGDSKPKKGRPIRH